MANRVLWYLFVTAPVVLGAVLSSSVAAIASETQSEVDAAEVSPSTSVESETTYQLESVDFSELNSQPTSEQVSNFDSNEDMLGQVQEYSASGSNDSLGQVTSISQLSDVQPTDWAFQALQSLVERYGCIAGYPDGTYRGNRAMTRYEFAAGMNACLDRINELIAAGLADVVTREDLAVLQRLQEEFAAELATLRGRVDALEARVAEVEANQFSTTTKLNATVQFLVSAIIDEPDGFDDEAVFVDRVRLNFDTSFTGEDRLRTRLEAGNFADGDGDPFTSDQIGFHAGGDSGNTFDIDDLNYEFPLFNNRVEVLVAAAGFSFSDLSTEITPLGSSDSGTISEFGDPRQYEQAFPGSGAGAGASVVLLENDSFTVSVDGAYIADDPSDSSPGSGLFNGDYAAFGQLVFSSDLVDVGLLYSNSYATDAAEFDQGVYDLDGPAVANTYGGQFNFKLFDEILEIGGGLAFSQINGIGASEDFELWSYQGTLAVNDLLGEGNRLGIVGGVLPYTRDLEDQADETSILVEGFYTYQLNDFIAITPSIIWISDPFNDDENDSTIIGSLRTLFRF